MQPWQAGHKAGSITKPRRANGQPYNGINVLMLWLEAMEKGFDAPLWMTYKQAQELGGQVKKGQKGSLVVYASTFKKEEETDTGETIERAIPFMKGYTVFNIEQIDNLPEHYYARNEPETPNTEERLKQADQFVSNTKATIHHGGRSAYFSPSDDHIQMPDYECFDNREAYYATLLHELTHWTGSKKRLDRDLTGRFKTKAYAVEELVAEMGSAFLCAYFGITPEVREDHASYLEFWLGILKEDKRAIFTASAKAQQAVDYLHGLQGD